MARVPETPELDVRRPFTRADAVRAGVDPRILRTSRFRRIFRGVYVDGEVPESPWLRTAAALALHPPTAFASHTSAARAYGLPVPTHPLEHVTVLAQEHRRFRPEIRNHATCRPVRVVRHRGIRVSHPYRMFVELASILSLVDLVVVGDAMLKVFDIPAARLVEECAASTDQHAGAAHRAACYVRDGVDSPMETRLRMLLVLAGLPEPQVNHELRDEQGRLLRRLDLSYPELRLVVEYDGRQHAESPQQWETDLERREELDDGHWKILVVTAKGIYREPERTLERVRRNLVERGCAAVPRRLSDAWQPFFPGRP